MDVTSPSWDPDRYLAYGDERGRPFVDLLSRVPDESPQDVIDLGCGPGNLTTLLGQRWPGATVTGVDSSPAMIEAAQRSGGGVRYVLGDLRDFQPHHQVDVLVSNAALQWVPDHVELLPRLVGWLRPGGWLAFQVPGNFAEPSHTLRRRLAAEPPYAEHTRDLDAPDAHDAATYLQALAGLGCAVDAWETTYLHVLHGPDPVFAWVSGTGARPTLQALPPGLRARFEDTLKSRLRAAYPETPAGVVMPFRRVFAVAQRAGSAGSSTESGGAA